MKTKILSTLVFIFSFVVIANGSFPVKPVSTNKTEVKDDTEKNISNAAFPVPTKASETVKAEELESPATSSKGKSQMIALLLALLIGTLGIHRFYLGYTTIGIIQLLTLGGCGIWALIDIIMIATGKLKPKDGDYTEKL